MADLKVGLYAKRAVAMFNKKHVFRWNVNQPHRLMLLRVINEPQSQKINTKYSAS